MRSEEYDYYGSKHTYRRNSFATEIFVLHIFFLPFQYMVRSDGVAIAQKPCDSSPFPSIWGKSENTTTTFPTQHHTGSLETPVTSSGGNWG